jgi:thiamine biosynthesis lipoprotein
MEPSTPAQRHLVMMGTGLTITVEAKDRPTALAASETMIEALNRTETRLSTWRDDTELNRLNRTPVDVPVSLSPELADELTEARRWWRETDGAFDPGIGALVEAWGLRRGGRLPSDEERRAALEGSGMAHLDLEGRAAIRRHHGMIIEEGGFGKGAGLDHAVASVSGQPDLSGVLDLGGQIVLFGRRENRTFGVADPRNREKIAVEIVIDHGSLATSGNSEKGFEIDGRRYGHILDPRTGYPAPDFGSLTVWANDGMTSDCLSTALYVLGPDAALAWASAHPGVEALVLEPLGDKLRIRATRGMRNRIRTIHEEMNVVFWTN